MDDGSAPDGVALVTGGSRGIGAAVVRGMAAAGWAVCLTYRTDDAAAGALVEEVTAAGGTARAVRADVAREDDVLAAFAAADELGPLTALVANAGVVGPRTRVDELTAERVERMLAVNTLGVGLAREVAGEAVRVNVVRPGVIDTGLHATGGQPDRAARLGPTVPLGRAGSAEEVAAAVLWLVGDAASYCTGSILDVSGGR